MRIRAAVERNCGIARELVTQFTQGSFVDATVGADGTPNTERDAIRVADAKIGAIGQGPVR
jgi:hypothetical protein